MAIPGSGAVIQANFDSNYGIQSFTVTNGGSGYSQTNPPKISIANVSTPTVAGIFLPIIVNGEITGVRVISSGSGYTPSTKVYDTAVGISSIGLTGSDSVVKAIYVSNPGAGYQSIPTVTISDPETLSGFGTYYFNEIIYGSRSKTEARVKEWDEDTKILKVSNVSIGSTQLGFFAGENIVGKESGATYSVKVYTEDDTYDKYTENDEFETLGDAIVDFTETNPFGTY